MSGLSALVYSVRDIRCFLDVLWHFLCYDLELHAALGHCYGADPT
jgi:hypothetical protein